MVVGITGNSGTGKTEIAKIISQKTNSIIINADEIVKKVTNSKTEYLEKIVELFGKKIIKKEKLDRKKLAEIIYNDEIARESLNKLTYKYIVKEIKMQIDNIKEKNVIIDAPLLFESGLDKMCDITISIIAEKEIKIQRICKRDDIDRKMAEARLNIQPKDEYYIEKSDYIFTNNGRIEKLNLEEICTKIGKN